MFRAHWGKIAGGGAGQQPGAAPLAGGAGGDGAPGAPADARNPPSPKDMDLGGGQNEARAQAGEARGDSGAAGGLAKETGLGKGWSSPLAVAG